jgi:hypothetical protein
MARKDLVSYEVFNDVVKSIEDVLTQVFPVRTGLADVRGHVEFTSEYKTGYKLHFPPAAKDPEQQKARVA